MKQNERHDLLLCLDLIRDWLRINPLRLMAQYEKQWLYRCETHDDTRYCFLRFPYLDHEGREVSDFLPDCPVELILGFAFRDDEIVGDISMFHMARSTLDNEKVFAALENDSDWLYWQMQLIRDCFDDCAPCTVIDHVLLYSSAYVNKDCRRRHIFTRLLAMSEAFVYEDLSHCRLFSSMALDPDIPMYGKDKITVPYVYSMKDEPDRIRNGMILEKYGFQPLKLETDEEVPDGCLLWFAVKEQEYREL